MGRSESRRFDYVELGESKALPTAPPTGRRRKTTAAEEPACRSGFLKRIGGSGSEQGRLRGPRGICLDPGNNLYVADAFNRRVQKFAPDAQATIVQGADRWLERPVDVAVTVEGDVIVCDEGQRRVVVYDGESRPKQIIGGSNGSPPYYRMPVAAATTLGGKVYILDQGTQQVQIYDGHLKHRRTIAAASPYAQSGILCGIAVGPEGHLYVSDAAAGMILVFEPGGRPIRSVNVRLLSGNKNCKPTRLSWAGEERMLVADPGCAQVWQVDPEGECEPLVDHAALPPVARYRKPEAAVIGGGCVYVSDSATDSIYVYAASD